MRKLCAATLFAAVMVPVVTYSVSAAQIAQSSHRPAGTAVAGISVAIASEPISSLNDPVMIDVEMRNVSGHDVILWAPGLSVTKNFHIVDTATNRVLYAAGGTDDFYGRNDRLNDVILRSGQSWFGSFDLLRHVFDLSAKHEYSVRLDLPKAGSSATPADINQSVDVSSNVILIKT